MGAKKRKLEVDADAERHLYSSFVCAANSISQLYSQAVSQQRKSSAMASRQTLERLAHWLMREYPNDDAIPKSALLQFLHQEYEGYEGCDTAAVPQVFPVLQVPGHHHQAAQIAEDADMQASQRCPQQPSLHNPGRRGAAVMEDAAAHLPGYGFSF